jgi:hypothetical protein
MNFLFAELIHYAQRQGYRCFSLGMAPLGGVGESRYARIGENGAGRLPLMRSIGGYLPPSFCSLSLDGGLGPADMRHAEARSVVISYTEYSTAWTAAIGDSGSDDRPLPAKPAMPVS